MTRFISALAGLLLASMSLAQPSSTGPLAPPANGPRHADSTFVAIVDCTVHPRPGASSDHATVVFKDGRIVAVMMPEEGAALGALAGTGLGKLSRNMDTGAAAGAILGGLAQPAVPSKDTAVTVVPAPAGARVIEGKGLHVYPCFIDAYVDVDAPAPEGDPASLHWNKKVTPQRSALDGAGVDAPTAESMRRMGFGAACISPRGGVFRGSSAVVSLAKPPDEQSAAKPPVYREKVYESIAFELGGGYPSSEMGAMALIRQTFIDADWQYEARRAGAVIAPNALDPLMPVSHEAGESTKDVAYRSWNEVLMDTDDELEVLRAVKVCKEFSRPLIVLGSGVEFQRLDAIKDACVPSERDQLMQKPSNTYPMAIPFVLPLNFPKAPDVSSYAKAEGVELRDLMAWEQAPTNPRRLAKAGITFALTTAKLGNKNEFPANLKTALKYGLDENQALAALTTIPAQMLGVEDQLGTLDAGKRANIILCDGPIFGEKTKIRTVFIDGQPHEISTAPVDLEGRWDLAVGGQPKEDHWLAIDKDNGVTVHLKDKSSKASKVAADQSKLSFVFDHEPLDGEQGVFVISAVIEKDAAGKPTRLVGQGLKATGEGFSWTGTRQPPTLAGSWPMKSETTSWEGGVLTFDEKNTLTFAGMPDLKPEDFSYEKGVLKFKAGDDSVEATVDFDTTPPQMKGTIKSGGEAVPFLAKRADRAPRLRLAGSWTPPTSPETWTELVFDNDTRGVLIVGDKQAKLEDVKLEGSRLSFSVDRTALDEGGVHKIEVKIDHPLLLPPTMTGTDTDADGKETKFAMQRRFGASPAGKWRITQTDGKDCEPGHGVTLDINTRGITITVTRPEGPLVIKSDDIHIKGDKASFSHDLEKLGMKGQSADEVTITTEINKAVMNGSGKLPDGTTHTYKAVKVTDEPVQVAAGLTMSQDEADRIKQIPEKLPLPFGPYGFFERPEAKTILFSNATIWTCGPQGIIANGDLWIKDGKIANFRAHKDGAADPDTLVIDCTGKSITPGIIDCHSHTGISRGVNEGGQAVTSQVRIADVTDCDDVNWYRQLAGGVTTVNSLHGSANAIGGQSQTNKLRWGCDSPEDMHFEGAKPGVKFALGENPRQVNFGGGRRGGGNDAPAVRYPATRMGVETLIRDRFTAAQEYDRAWKAFYGQPHADASPGMMSDEPGDDLQDRIEATRQALKQSETDAGRLESHIKEIEDQIASLSKNKDANANQLDSLTKSRDQYSALRSNLSMNHNRLALLLADLEKRDDKAKPKAAKPAGSAAPHAGAIPPRRDLELEALAEVLRGERLVHCHSYRQDEILMLCQVARDFGFKIGTFQHALEGYKVADYIRDTTWGGASGFADWWAYKVEVQDAIPAAFPIMHDVGVNVSFNSDSNELARRLNVDAAKAVKYGGLTEEDALKFVTINPARQLQIDKWVGSIEVGKDADLAIWSGDPLSSLSRCEATYVDGRCLFSLEQDQEHRKRISAERQRLIQKILGEGKPRGEGGDAAEGEAGPRRGPGGPGPGGFGGRRRGQRPPQSE
jgi:imidazolonepropionase-like amidohydrolase